MEIGSFFAVAIISLLGAMSPGPDFAIVTKNCLKGNFKKGAFTAMGIAAALLIHVSYSILGIALVIVESPVLFQGIKYIGAIYLFYLGVLLIKEKASKNALDKTKTSLSKMMHGPFISGFFCNLLNPKATLFILGLFTQFIQPNSPFYAKVVLGGIIVLIGLGWFVFLSFLITHHRLQKHFANFQFIIMKTMGVVLCLVSVYVAIFS
ncbi:MAG: LysE family transporter [Chlamydiae bacterium]|nr:LysE family transporter [Chlamydiota bacterium]